MGMSDRLDRFQRDHRRVGVAVATVKKFQDDRSLNMAGLLAFWGVFSLFPLLLVFVTVLGWVVPADERQDILGQVGEYFPLIDVQSVDALGGEVWALAVGLATALWTGSAAVRIAQDAFNSVWEIPMAERPGLGAQLLRSLWVLATIGLGFVVVTLVSGFSTGQASGVDYGWGWRVVGLAFAVVADVALFVAVFRILSERELSTRDVLPGALLAGIAFWVLQQASTLIISRYLNNAQDTYGSFATVITVLWWFYLQAIVTLLGAQLNAVLEKRLYPRSLTGGPQTEADRRALQEYVEERTYHEDQEAETRMSGDDEGSSEGATPWRWPSRGRPPDR